MHGGYALGCGHATMHAMHSILYEDRRADVLMEP